MGSHVGFRSFRELKELYGVMGSVLKRSPSVSVVCLFVGREMSVVG